MAPPPPPPHRRVDSSVWAVVLDPATGGGCSTLDLLKRVPYDDASEPSPHVSASARAEMTRIALRMQWQEEINLTSKNARQLATMATLGERLNRPKEQYVPGTPVERRLKAGRLVRSNGRDGSLSSSRSAPALPKAELPVVDRDTLEQAVHLHQRQSTETARLLVYPEDTHTAELQGLRQQLELQLLEVTQKICRKYTKRLFPRPVQDGSPDELSQQAAKWAHSEALSETEKYSLYMSSRFTTQQQRDFYRRELEQREPESDRHKRETAHTKYGDALARSKHSLRANF